MLTGTSAKCATFLLKLVCGSTNVHYITICLGTSGLLCSNSVFRGMKPEVGGRSKTVFQLHIQYPPDPKSPRNFPEDSVTLEATPMGREKAVKLGPSLHTYISQG